MTVQKEKKRRDPRVINLTSHSSVKHPLGVKPAGNIYFQDTDAVSKARQQSLGYLAPLPDDMISSMMFYLSIPELKSLMETSKYLYVFLSDEEFWRKYYMRFLNSDQSDIRWKGSWKKTILNWSKDVEISPVSLMMSDHLYRPFQIAHLNYRKMFDALIDDEWNMKVSGINSPGRIPRFKKVDNEQFKELIDSPFIVTDYKWPQWTLDTLKEQYGNLRFRQESVDWSLNSFIDYLTSNNDEIPLYLFDCNSDAIKQLRTEYHQSIPSIFKTDYFNYFDSYRPDHSWLIIGNQNSGSTFHKDPNNTSAWNACITGKKLWLMLPPHITPPGVSTNQDQSEITSPVSIGEWILSGFYGDILKIPDTQIAITFPGECMYVPSNWWHLVINLDTSIAITENFVPQYNLSPVLEFFKFKSSQISGFKLNDIIHLINKLSYKGPEILDFIKLQQEKHYTEQELHDDCGEVSNLPAIPIFEIFQQLLIDNNKEAELNEALKTVKGTNTKPKPLKTQSVWSTIKESSPSTTGFSFNFAAD